MAESAGEGGASARGPVPAWFATRSAARCAAVVLAVGLVGLASTACAPILRELGGDEPLPPPSAQGPCAEVAVRSCALPYPSDEFTVADATSPTGVRVEVPEGVLPPPVVAAMGPGASFDAAFGGRDGFSAVGPVVFEVSAPVRPEALPGDGGEVLVVMDAATGERQEVRAHVWDDALVRGAPATVVMAWPRTRWEYGHTYVARLAGLPGLLGSPRRPAAVARPAGRIARIRDTLAAHGDTVAWSEVLSATSFTVGSRAGHVGDLVEMADIARGEDHPVRGLSTMAPVGYSHGAATVTGQVRLTDFRDGDGVASSDHGTRQEWADFLLTVPAEPATPAGAPVVVYGHGLLAFKESMLVVASQNAAAGVATISIDVPNHGSRQAGQGGHLLDLTKPATLGRLAGLPVQAIVDHVSLVQAILGHLHDIDRSPWSPDGRHGDGRPDLDTSLLLYAGTSMGAVLGLAEYALVPELAAALLQVPGVGIVDILSHSDLWPVFSPIIPSGATAGDAAFLLGAATMLLDRADATHLLDEVRDAGRPVLAQVGVSDSVVPAFSTDRLVRLLGLPRIGAPRAEARTLSQAQAEGFPADGRGFVEVWPQVEGFLGHLTFVEPAAQRLVAEWLDGRLVEAGLAPVP